jgi:hypothetical protein
VCRFADLRDNIPVNKRHTECAYYTWVVNGYLDNSTPPPIMDFIMATVQHLISAEELFQMPSPADALTDDQILPGFNASVSEIFE